MALIRTPQEVKKYLKIDVTANSTATLPDMVTAERKYLVPIIGSTLYKLLVEAYNSDDVTGTRYVDLLDMVQAALAPLAFFNDRAFINVRITEAGFRKTMTAEQAPIYKWDYQALSSALMERGMEAIENLLFFLESEAETFPEWMDDPVYTAYTSFVIRNGSQFNQAYTLAFPRYCFLQLCPVIRTVEDMYIKKTIGGVFTDSLKQILTPSVGVESEVLRLIRAATANLTIHHAVSRMGVETTARGFVVSLLDKDQYEGQQQTADNNSLFKLAEESARIGEAYLRQATSLLNANASQQLFPLYFQSTYYQAPGAPQRSSINSRLKSSFVI